MTTRAYDSTLGDGGKTVAKLRNVFGFADSSATFGAALHPPAAAGTLRPSPVTAGQREDDLRLARYIKRHQLVSAMNDTKWREVVACLRGIPGYWVEFRVRCVRDPVDAVPRRDRSFPWHLLTYTHIEWLDIDPLVRRISGAVDRGKGEDLTDVLLTSLKAIPAPVSRENGYLRIWGYYRPGEPHDTL